MEKISKDTMYYCPNCRINPTTAICHRCHHRCVIMPIPSERNWESDPTYFEYVLNQKKRT